MTAACTSENALKFYSCFTATTVLFAAGTAAVLVPLEAHWLGSQVFLQSAGWPLAGAGVKLVNGKRAGCATGAACFSATAVARSGAGAVVAATDAAFGWQLVLAVVFEAHWAGLQAGLAAASCADRPRPAVTNAQRRSKRSIILFFRSTQFR
jgi:hypothetical protein